MSVNRVVTIGTSAGGIQALSTLLTDLSPSLPAAVLIVMHVPSERESMLAKILDRVTTMKVREARDGDRLRDGAVFIAPPDQHMLVADGAVRLGRGPTENGSRPAVDPLFRSAALDFGPRAIGVVLTGLLGDGTAGMFAIKRRGGITVVQDPKDAEFAQMPASALRATEVDFVGTVPEIARFVTHAVEANIMHEGVGGMDDGLQREVDIASGADNGRMGVAGYPPSVFSCPDCGGVLWEIRDGPEERFRCRTGHAYSEEALLDSGSHVAEKAIWSAVRSLAEHAELFGRLVQRAHDRGDQETARRFEERRAELLRSLEFFRRVVVSDESPGAGESVARAS
jgi:two-component system chemotaxis response regulator CheB